MNERLVVKSSDGDLQRRRASLLPAAFRLDLLRLDCSFPTKRRMDEEEAGFGG